MDFSSIPCPDCLREMRAVKTDSGKIDVRCWHCDEVKAMHRVVDAARGFVNEEQGGYDRLKDAIAALDKKSVKETP